jgi:hypothetical protein
MNIEVNVTKKRFLFTILSFFVLAGAIFVFAYNDAFDNVASEAVSFGHSADELVVKMDDGSLATVQDLLSSGGVKGDLKYVNLTGHSTTALSQSYGTGTKDYDYSLSGFTGNGYDDNSVRFVHIYTETVGTKTTEAKIYAMYPGGDYKLISRHVNYADPDGGDAANSGVFVLPVNPGQDRIKIRIVNGASSYASFNILGVTQTISSFGIGDINYREATSYVAFDSNNGGGANNLRAVVFCENGEVLTGGGCYAYSYQTELKITRPIQENGRWGWECNQFGNPDTSGQRFITAYAICVK